MRRPIAPCACVLALLTGAWVGQAYSLLAPLDKADVSVTSTAGAVETVRHFYDAIDSLLRTGDDSNLRGVIAEDFVDHGDDPGALSDRDALLGYLAALRVTYPALRLVPEDMIAQGDRVVARLAPDGMTQGAVLGIPLAGASPWPQVDIVRVHGGLITERWGATGYAPSVSLYSELLPLGHGGNLVSAFQRVTFAPGARDQTYTHLGPAILFLESGSLDISTDDLREPRSSDDVPPGAGGDITLGPGETLIIPKWVAFASSNRTDAPAVLLLVMLDLPNPPPTTRSTNDETILPDPGVTTRLLAARSVTSHKMGGVTAGLARVTLAPGMRLAAHEVAWVELVAVDAGTVTVTVRGDESSAWRLDPIGRSTALGPSGQLEEGFGLSVFGKEVAAEYRNETDRPATLLLLTLEAG